MITLFKVLPEWIAHHPYVAVSILLAKAVLVALTIRHAQWGRPVARGICDRRKSSAGRTVLRHVARQTPGYRAAGLGLLNRRGAVR